MKTNVQETSLLAYYGKVLPRLPECQDKVLDVFWSTLWENFEEDCPEFESVDDIVNVNMTNMELARMLGWSINRVTPRVYALREMGFLVKHRRRMCSVTGNTAMAWRPVR